MTSVALLKVPSVAPGVGLLNVSATVSSPSKSASSWINTLSVWLVSPGRNVTGEVKPKKSAAPAVPFVAVKVTVSVLVNTPTRRTSTEPMMPFSLPRKLEAANSNSVSSFTMNSMALLCPPNGTPPVAFERTSVTLSSGSTRASSTKGTVIKRSVTPGGKESVPFVPK